MFDVDVLVLPMLMLMRSSFCGRCEFAVPMGAHGAFVPLDKSWEVGDAIMTTFRDFGYRYNPRTKCRLMYLIDDMGIDGFRAEVEKRYKASTGLTIATEGASRLSPA